jgi:hypothetical protein
MTLDSNKPPTAMDDLDLGQRLALPYESDDTSISVPAEITGIGLPAVRVETDSGEVFIRHARNVRDWRRHLRHA